VDLAESLREEHPLCEVPAPPDTVLDACAEQFLVALDSGATVDADAVTLLIDTLPDLVGLVAKPGGLTRRIQVSTHAPDREFLLDIAPDSSQLTATGAPGAGADGDELRLPAEAFLRLVYGRLDPEHVPPGVGEDANLDVLRPVFPGL